jgi:prolyl oligopeptidase PreP (S9A serine peptidase family)
MTARKLRFPLLIGGGVVAAAGLVYFSHSRITSQQSVGAIGQRDVYRDAQANSADVGTPGSAPVAVTAILQDKQFRSLAKNQAFQNLLGSQAFQVLTQDKAFVNLIATNAFQVMAANPVFVQLVTSVSFQQALNAAKEQVATSSQAQALSASMSQDSNYQALQNIAAFNGVLSSSNFAVLAGNPAFVNLVASAPFQSMVNNQAFVALVNESQFQNVLLQGSAANLAAAVQVQ